MKPREIERSREWMLCRTLKVNSATPKGGLKTSKVNSATIKNREKPREIESDDFQNSMSLRFYASARGLSALLGSLGEIDF